MVTTSGLSQPAAGRVARGLRGGGARQGQRRTVDQTAAGGDGTRPDGLKQVLMKQWILAPSLRASAVTWPSQSLWHPPPGQPGSRGWRPWPGRRDTILVQLDLSQVPLGQGTHSLWPVPLLGKVAIRHPRRPAALRVSGVGWQPVARVGPLMKQRTHLNQ